MVSIHFSTTPFYIEKKHILSQNSSPELTSLSYFILVYSFAMIYIEVIKFK